MTNSYSWRKYINLLYPVISGILSGTAVANLNPWLIWIALIPLLFVLPATSLKRAIIIGAIYGIVVGIFIFYWIPEAINRYFISDTLMGIPLFVFMCIYYSIFPIFFSFLYTIILKKRSAISSSIFINVIVVAFLWTISEWLRIKIFPGVSWLKDTVSLCQSPSLTGIQLVSVTGLWGVSFVIIAVNQLLAAAFKLKRYKYGIYGIALIGVFYLSGYVIFNLYDSRGFNEIDVAIIQQNLKGEEKWNANNGDKLALELLYLNREAASYNPDLIVWSETAIPWYYAPDDELINGALNITRQTKAEHLIGISSLVSEGSNDVYNSAYLINHQGNILSRYDKETLLSLLETPYLSKNIRIPFLLENAYGSFKYGSNNAPLKSENGDLGVLICNETSTAYEAMKSVNHGAKLLINLSNDTWFENTHFINWHFHVCRLRAVETGKDMIINSNRGIGGIIRGDGKIEVQQTSNKPICIKGTVKFREHTSLYSKLGDWVIYLGMIVLIFIFFRKTENSAKAKV